MQLDSRSDSSPVDVYVYLHWLGYVYIYVSVLVASSCMDRSICIHAGGLPTF